MTQPKEQTKEREELSKQAGYVSFITFLSRIFGLLRDSLIASLLGAREAADAFYVAFRIPNLLRRLLAEGCLTISFIPVFTEYLKEDPKEAKKVANITFTFLSLLLLLITATGVIFAAAFVKFTAFGFTDHPDKFQLTVMLTRITFPYIFLVSLGALAMGILNSLKHFSTPAASPILLNIGIIGGALLLGPYTPNRSIALAIGVLIGGTLQIVMQIPPLLKRGYLPRFQWDPKNPGARKVLRLMLPSIYGSAVYQLNLFAITFMASFLSTGAVTYLWYADRVMEFPLGVFAISFATVILPQLSEHAAEKNIDKLKETFRHGLKMIYWVNLPAMAGLIILAYPIISVLFEHGKFSSESARLTAQALQCFAIGLPFVSGARIIASVFYSLQDSKTPVRAANVGILMNIVMGAILLKPFGHLGLAMGVASGSICNFSYQLFSLHKKLGKLNLQELSQTFLKILFSTLCMAAALWLSLHFLSSLFGKTFLERGILLLILVSVGVLTYATLTLLLKVEQTNDVMRVLKRKLLRR